MGRFSIRHQNRFENWRLLNSLNLSQQKSKKRGVIPKNYVKMSFISATPQKIHKDRSHVQVVIRSRPILPQESENLDISGQKSDSVLDLNEPEGQVIVALEKTFAFDAVYSSDSPQESIYQNVADKIVDGFVRNMDSNATILAYGQTGAGKKENSRNFT